MSNTCSGYIFVGVHDDGTIVGVSKWYNNKPKDSWDALWRAMAASEFANFHPNKPLANSWVIPISSEAGNDFRVLAIKVNQQRTPFLSYLGEEYIRIGPMSQRRNAVR